MKNLIKNNELARLVKNFSTGKISIAYFNLTGLEKREGIIDEYLYRSTYSFYMFLICGFILLISIIVFLWIFFSLNNRKYVLTNKEIIHSKGSIGLTKEELLFIKYFLKQKIVSNAQVMSLFIEKSKYYIYIFFYISTSNYPSKVFRDLYCVSSVSYTHLTLPTKRIV